MNFSKSKGNFSSGQYNNYTMGAGDYILMANIYICPFSVQYQLTGKCNFPPAKCNSTIHSRVQKRKRPLAFAVCFACSAKLRTIRKIVYSSTRRLLYLTQFSLVSLYRGKLFENWAHFTLSSSFSRCDELEGPVPPLTATATEHRKKKVNKKKRRGAEKLDFCLGLYIREDWRRF